MERPQDDDYRTVVTTCVRCRGRLTIPIRITPAFVGGGLMKCACCGHGIVVMVARPGGEVLADCCTPQETGEQP